MLHHQKIAIKYHTVDYIPLKNVYLLYSEEITIINVNNRKCVWQIYMYRKTGISNIKCRSINISWKHKWNERGSSCAVKHIISFFRHFSYDLVGTQPNIRGQWFLKSHSQSVSVNVSLFFLSHLTCTLHTHCHSCFSLSSSLSIFLPSQNLCHIFHIIHEII